MPQMGIQPEVKVNSRGREREKRRERDTGETSPATGSVLYCSEGLLYFDKKWRSMGNTKLSSVSSPDSYQNQAFLSAYLIVYTSLR